MNINTAGQTAHEHKTEINAGHKIYKHTQMQNSSIIQRKKHKYIPTFDININYRDEVNSSTYLSMKNSPATSYVAATFHPTIGQRAHQYLSTLPPPSWA